MRLRHLDLFSGMGGFAIAVHQLGHETVGFCDNDKAAQELLSLRWPGVPVYEDIRALKGSDVGPVDLVTGGFPCQPFSIAGNQRGAIDDRHLWPEMARIIAECRPRYVLGENVTGIVKMELDTCISDLEAIGYTARAIVVPAVGTDAPHRRERVWILAHDDSGHEGQPVSPREDGATPVTGKRGETVAQSEGIGEREQAAEALALADGRDAWEVIGRGGELTHSLADAHGPRQQSSAQRWDRSRDGLGDDGSHVSDTDGARQCEQRRTQPGGEELSASEQHRRWPVEPGVGRVAHGIPRRVDRLRMLENGIVPAVAYEVLKVMIGEAA